MAVAAGREGAEGQAGAPIFDARLVKCVSHHAFLAVGALVFLVVLELRELVLLSLAGETMMAAPDVPAVVPRRGRLKPFTFLSNPFAIFRIRSNAFWQ